MIKILITTLLILGILLNPISSQASKISVSSIIIDFKNNTKYLDVPVSNINENGEKAYVKNSLFEILNPGTPEQERIPLKKGSEQSIIASPQKMIIPFKGSKNIRLVSLHNNLEKDAIYRLNITPFAGDSKEKETVVKVLIAYDVLVIIRPKNPKTEYEVKRDGRKITITNTGNTNFVIDEGAQCSPTDPTKCDNLIGTRLYAGNSKTFDLKYDTKVDLSFTTLESIKKESY